MGGETLTEFFQCPLGLFLCLLARVQLLLRTGMFRACLLQGGVALERLGDCLLFGCQAFQFEVQLL